MKKRQSKKNDNKNIRYLYSRRFRRLLKIQFEDTTKILKDFDGSIDRFCVVKFIQPKDY